MTDRQDAEAGQPRGRGRGRAPNGRPRSSRAPAACPRPRSRTTQLPHRIRPGDVRAQGLPALGDGRIVPTPPSTREPPLPRPAVLAGARSRSARYLTLPVLTKPDLGMKLASPSPCSRRGRVRRPGAFARRPRRLLERDRPRRHGCHQRPGVRVLRSRRPGRAGVLRLRERERRRVGTGHPLHATSTTRYDPAQTIQQTRRLVEQERVFAIFNSSAPSTRSPRGRYLNQLGPPAVRRERRPARPRRTRRSTRGRWATCRASSREGGFYGPPHREDAPRATSPSSTRTPTSVRTCSRPAERARRARARSSPTQGYAVTEADVARRRSSRCGRRRRDTSGSSRCRSRRSSPSSPPTSSAGGRRPSSAASRSTRSSWMSPG